MARSETVLLAKLPEWIEMTMKGISPRIKRAAKATAQRGRNVIMSTIKHTAPFPPVDRGSYRASWQVEEEPDGATLFSDAPHAEWIERGTRPHRPPIGPILAWVERKRLAPKGKGMGIARAIQKRIELRGTPPKRVLERSLPEIERIFNEEVDQALQDWESGGRTG